MARKEPMLETASKRCLYKERGNHIAIWRKSSSGRENSWSNAPREESALEY